MKNSNILLGVTGGIAAYKAAEICRSLVKRGAQVQVVMSQAACEFITPLTMETLSSRPVPVEMFGRKSRPLEHIEVPDEADIMLVAPATADYIARCAQGRACDLLSSITLAFTGTVIFAPAMNTNMWKNPATRRNIETLVEEHGWIMVPPGSGELACGWTGEGRMADVDQIMSRVDGLFKNDLDGRKLLVSAGPTVEDLDPVRFIANRSSGKMGYSIAEAAAKRGGKVILVSGPTDLPPPSRVETIQVRSALEMRDTIFEHADLQDGIVMCAAVADYRPVEYSENKIKKNEDEDKKSLELVKNPDILMELGRKYSSKGPVLVGFALETGDLVTLARNKMKKKGAGIMVANQPSNALGGDFTSAVLLNDRGKQEETGPLSKKELAHKILDELLSYWES